MKKRKRMKVMKLIFQTKHLNKYVQICLLLMLIAFNITQFQHQTFNDTDLYGRQMTNF